MARLENRAGIENYIINLYRNVDRALISFDFLCFNQNSGPFDSEIESRGGKIYRISPISKRLSSLKRHKNNIVDFFEKHSFDIVQIHGNSAISLMDASIIKRVSKSTVVLHSHSSNVGSLRQRIVHSFLKRKINKVADCRFGCSKYAWDWMFLKPFDKRRDFIIPNGINSRSFLFSKEKRENIRKELGVDESCILIGSVGRLVKPKNFLFLLDLFKCLVDSSNNNYKLIIVGDGEMRHELETKTARLGLANQVIFTGQVSNVQDYYMAMDIFVLCSKWEGLPICLLEAQASGLPCILSSSVTDEVLIDGLRHCVVNKKSSPEEWVSLIKKECVSSYEERTKQNLVFSQSIFDLTKSTKVVFDIYSSKVNQKS